MPINNWIIGADLVCGVIACLNIGLQGSKHCTQELMCVYVQTHTYSFMDTQLDNCSKPDCQ